MFYKTYKVHHIIGIEFSNYMRESIIIWYYNMWVVPYFMRRVKRSYITTYNVILNSCKFIL